MKPVSHQYEDKLLEFAYGELPAHEASAVESHLKSCARCTSALDQIRTVRNAMSALPAQVPSDKGLDSLMAYAEQAARRNAQAAAPAPFFSKWMKWVAPLAGVTAVLLVGGVYLQASRNVDLSRHTAVAESVKKADDSRKGWESPPPPVQPDAPKQELKTIDEAAEKPADALAQAAPQEKDVADFEAGTKAAPLRKTVATKATAKKELSRQRDDKEAALDGFQANEPPPKVEAAAHAAEVNQAGKGGGGRAADTSNYYDAKTNGYPKAGLSTGPSTNNAQLGSELSKADNAAPRGSLEKRSAPKEQAKAKEEESNDLDRAKLAQNDSEPYRAKKSKKGSTAQPSNNVGGGEIVNPTGSYSSSVANKPAEAKPEAKKPAPEPVSAPVADKKSESELTVAANEGSQGATKWGVSSGAKDAKTRSYDQPVTEQQQVRREAAPPQQQVASAPQPPPAATQSSSPGSSSMRLAPGLQRGKASTGEDDSMYGGDVQGPPSSDNTKQLAASKAARQAQLTDLMKQARAANNAGDLNTELKLSLQLLQSDAEGDLRAEGLYHMCTGLQRLGNEDEAQKYCVALAKEYPQSIWAAKSRSEQKNQRSMPAKAAERRKVESYDEAEKPAPSPPPKKSAPADAVQAY